MGNYVDITGERYGKLVAIKRMNERSKSGGYMWLFQCDCGKQKVLSSNTVRSHGVKSCGCLTRKHGEKRTRLYNIWCAMRERCRDGKPGHENWGGRGISVCKEWDEFLDFKSWALSNGYRDDLTIDRINNNGNYEPSNCRWVSYKVQANNTRKNRLVSIDGITHTVSEWCDLLGNVTRSQVYKRMKYGLTIEEALITPYQKRKSFSPDITDKKYNKNRIPVIGKNGSEVLRFDSGKEAERMGFCRELVMKAAKGKAKCKSNRHYYKGYIWEVDNERKAELMKEMENTT